MRRLCRKILRRRTGAHGRRDKGLVVGLSSLGKGEISFLHGLLLVRLLAPVGSVLDVGSLWWRGAGEFLDVRVERVEGRFVFDFAGLGVGFVGVLAFADGLEYAGGVPFCEFDLLEDVWLGGSPFVGEIEEGGGSVERVCGLSSRDSS